MPFKIVRNDITKVNADVLVNSANTKPICAGYRTDAAIYEAAGFGIAEECSANFVNDKEGIKKCYEAQCLMMSSFRSNKRDRSWKDNIEADVRNRGRR